MAITILKAQDAVILLDLLYQSFEIKCRKLQRPDSFTQMCDYYADAAAKLGSGQIEIHRRGTNLITWLLDQFAHSGDRFWREPRTQEGIEICCQILEGRYSPGAPKPQPKETLFDYL